MKVINYNADTLMNDAPIIRKLGVVSSGMEMTPIVRHGKRYRVETQNGGDPVTCHFHGGFCLRDLSENKCGEVVGRGWHFFSAICEDDTVFVFGTNDQKSGEWGGDTIRLFYSSDLENWSVKDVLHREGWKIYNTSVCRSEDGFTMAYEVGAPSEKVGKPFTIFFAKSKNMFDWETVDDELCFSRDRYVACPALRYLPDDKYYYMIALEELPLARYAPYIYRTHDLETWEIGLHNPIFWISREDRIPAPGCEFDAETLKLIKTHMNINNCDIDLCEHEGKTYINYLTGNQLGTGFMCEAVFDGTQAEYLRAHFE